MLSIFVFCTLLTIAQCFSNNLNSKCEITLNYNSTFKCAYLNINNNIFESLSTVYYVDDVTLMNLLNSKMMENNTNETYIIIDHHKLKIFEPNFNKLMIKLSENGIKGIIIFDLRTIVSSNLGQTLTTIYNPYGNIPHDFHGFWEIEFFAIQNMVLGEQYNILSIYNDEGTFQKQLKYSNITIVTMTFMILIWFLIVCITSYKIIVMIVNKKFKISIPTNIYILNLLVSIYYTIHFAVDPFFLNHKISFINRFINTLFSNFQKFSYLIMLLGFFEIIFGKNNNINTLKYINYTIYIIQFFLIITSFTSIFPYIGLEKIYIYIIAITVIITILVNVIFVIIGTKIVINLSKNSKILKTSDNGPKKRLSLLVFCVAIVYTLSLIVQSIVRANSWSLITIEGKYVSTIVFNIFEWLLSVLIIGTLIYSDFKKKLNSSSKSNNKNANSESRNHPNNNNINKQIISHNDDNNVSIIQIQD